MLSLSLLSVIAVTDTFPVVFFHLNNHFSLPLIRGYFLFLSISLLYIPGVYAVDQIDIQIGKIVYDDKVLTDVEARVDIHDKDIAIDAGVTYLNKRYTPSMTLQPRHWQLMLAQSFTTQQFIDAVSTIYPDAADLSFDGLLHAQIELHGRYSGETPVQGITFVLKPENIRTELEAYELALDAVDMHISGKLHTKANTWHGNIQVQYPQGAILWKDWFVAPHNGPMTLGTEIAYQASQVQLENLVFTDPETLHIKIPRAVMHTDNPNKRDADITLTSHKLGKLYLSWLQPKLFDTILEDAEIEGQASLALNIRDNAITHAHIEIDNMSLADNQGRLAIYDAGLSGHIKGDLESGEMAVSWGTAEIHRLQFGKTNSMFVIKNQGIELADETSIPFYDGAFKVFNLDVGGFDKPYPDIRFNAALTPVSLSALTPALGLPPFSGSLSGVIPSVHYAGDTLVLDGTLLAKAFDGSFKVKDLRINRILGDVPRMTASFFLQDLNLESLTQTFDFGRIEGRLSGYITDLEMVAWQPQSFDAFFYTPENDESRHVISQRAVDNLTSLSGSDIGSVLSRGYLRFFKNFRYERLGIGCRLRNNICYMNGIEAAEDNAYYIVKGSWLPPRLDIKGYSREVDWPDLLSRLRRVMSDNEVIIH